SSTDGGTGTSRPLTGAPRVQVPPPTSPTGTAAGACVDFPQGRWAQGLRWLLCTTTTNAAGWSRS
ncbi:unnamed protein product, partial [Phaeothamnion confervicola]